MEDSFDVNGKAYVSSKRLAEKYGYTNDHISRLCRQGKVQGKRVARTWFVDEDDLVSYQSEMNGNGWGNGHAQDAYAKDTTSPTETAIAATPLAREAARQQQEARSQPTSRYTPEAIDEPFPNANKQPRKTEEAEQKVTHDDDMPNERGVKPHIAETTSTSHSSRTHPLLQPVALPLRNAVLFLSILSLFSVAHAVNDPTHRDALYEETAKFVFGAEEFLTSSKSLAIGEYDDTLASVASVQEATKTFIDTAALSVYRSVEDAKVRTQNRILSWLGIPNGVQHARNDTFYLGGLPNTGFGSETDQPRVVQETRVVERVVERQVDRGPIRAQTSGISRDVLETRLQEVENGLRQQIFAVRGDIPESNSIKTVTRTVAHTNRIDKLDNVTISNATVDGVSGLTDSDIPDGLTASNYLPLAGGTLTGALTGTDATFSGALTTQGSVTFYTEPSFPSFNATSTTATSTIAGSLEVDGDLTVSGSQSFSGGLTLPYFSATSTATSSSVAYRLGIGTTSPYATLSVSGSAVVTDNITASNFTATSSTASVFPYASSTAITTTSFFPTDIYSFTLQGDLLANGQNITGIGTATGTNSIFTNATTTNATSTNFFTSILDATTGTFTNLTTVTYDATSGTTTNATSTNFFTALLDATTGTITNFTATDATTTNATSTNLFTQNFTADGKLTLNGVGTDMLLSLNSANELTATSTPTLSHLFATSTTATSTFAGGINIGSGNFVVDFTTGFAGAGTAAPIAPLHVAGRCVTGDTRLRRRRRRLPAARRRRHGQKGAKGTTGLSDAELSKRGFVFDDDYVYDEVEITYVKEGDEVASLDPKTGMFVYSKVNNMMPMGIKPIVYIRTTTGRSIRTTENHPYLVRSAPPKEAEEQHTQKLYRFEVDQSVKIEDFSRDTVVAVANAEQSFTLTIPRKEKQRLRDNMRRFNKPKKLNAVVFALGIAEAMKRAPFTIHELAIDTEYIGYEHTIAGIIADAFPQTPEINFLPVGKKSPAHFAAIGVHKQEKTADTSADTAAFTQTENALRTAAFPTKARNLAGPGAFLNSTVYDGEQFVKRGVWTTVNDIRVGQYIAVAHGGTPAWERVEEMKILPEEQVYDIEIEGTHNFIGNDVVAHNTYLNGDVGIKQASPTYDLDVSGDARFTGLVDATRFVATSTTATSTFAGGLSAAGASGLTVLQDGTVGIGTTSPSSKLSVHGDALFSGDISTANLTATGTASISGTASITGEVTLSNTTGGILETDSSGTVSATSTINDFFISDALTISSSGSVADGALSSNVSLLGQTIESSEITDGTVANVDLANSSVSYGGVSVSLGDSDATPAFDLTDATNLPIVGGTTGTLTVARGGTGQSSFGQGWLHSTGGTSALTASTSPTVNYITATSTTATSTFAWGIKTTALDVTSTNATSTFANGIQLSGGCFLLADGTCAGSGGGGAFTSSGGFTTLSTETDDVGIGTSSPYAKLSVWGESASQGLAFNAVNSASTTLFSIPNDASATSTFATNLSTTGSLAVGNNFISGTATSTFASGIDLTSGCFAIAGSCRLTGSGDLTAGDLDTTLNVMVNAMQHASSSAKYIGLTNGFADSFGSASSANLSGVDEANSNNIATGTNGIIGTGIATSTGGTITSISGDWLHEFKSSGTFTSTGNGNVEVLVVGGGGGGGDNHGGGGGAGGLIHKNTEPVSGDVTVVVGAGGAGGPADGSAGDAGDNGGSSSFGDITAGGGGGGGSRIATDSTNIGKDGASGGGGAGTNPTTAGSSTSTDPEKGNDGGAGSSGSTAGNGGGGGGAGAAGGAASGTSAGAGTSGDGGNGIDLSSSFGTSLGDSGWFAGGGAGGRWSSGSVGTPGNGGGGTGGNDDGVAGGNGTANTGGGGGGGGGAEGGGGDGGSGVVVVRYTPNEGATLRSSTFTASTSPDTAKLIIAATSTSSFSLNTDLNAAVSRDGGTSWATTTLTQLGTTLEDGTKLYGDTSVDISGQPSGTQMQYRIIVENAAIDIHGVSLTWGEVSAQNAGTLAVTGSLSADSLSLTSALPVSSGGTGWSNITADAIIFGNGTSALATSSQLTFDSNNNRLGVGTSTPYSKLTVWGGSSGNIFEAVTNASSSAFVIDNAGDIGVGTTSPSSKFTVYGNAFLEGANRYLNFGATTSVAATGYGFRDNSGTLQFKNANGTWSDLGSGGAFTSSGGFTTLSTETDDVGIGTSSPYAKLSVWGESASSGLAFNAVNSASTTLFSIPNDASATSTFATNLQVNGNLQVGSGTLTLDSNSITSSGQLTINGTGTTTINTNLDLGASNELALGDVTLRNNSGTLQFKNQGGSWTNVGSDADDGGLQNIQVYTTVGTTTWNKPADIDRVRVQVVGGGGGGAGGHGGNNDGGGGGGAGGYAEEFIDVSNTSSVEVVVGSGGGAGGTGSNGSAGGETKFGTFLSATGGSGGNHNGGGGTGGSGSDGDVNLTGGGGGASGGNANRGGVGGSSYFTGGGGVPAGAGNTGSGGGGQNPTNSSGGAGGDGMVIVYEYGVDSSTGSGSIGNGPASDQYVNLTASSTPGADTTSVDITADYMVLVDDSDNAKQVANVDVTADITVSGAGGLDTGTEASGTWYYIYLINNDSTTKALLSTSATDPTMPTGYTYKRLVSAVRNDGSSNFLPYKQFDEEVWYAARQSIASGLSSTSYTTQDVSALIPTASGRAKMGLFGAIGDLNENIFISTDGVNAKTIFSGNSSTNSVGQTDELYESSWASPIYVPVNGNNVYYKVTASSWTLYARAYRFSLKEQAVNGAANSLFAQTGDDIYRLNGNLGVGTSTPHAKLTVNGGSGPQFLLSDPNGAVDQKHVYASSTNGALAFGALDDSLSTYTEHMRIDASGNVGIGTTSPASTLDVWGNLTVGTSSIPTLFADSSTGFVGAGTSSPASTLDVWGDFRVGTSSTPTLFTDVSTGRVGVGTTSPAAKLHVKGDYLRLEESAGAGRTLDIYPAITGTNHRFTSDTTSGGYQFENTNGELMRIHSDGNVGIGNTLTKSFTNEGSYNTLTRIGAESLGSDNASSLQIGGRSGSVTGELAVLEFFNTRDDDIAAKIVARRDGSAGNLDYGALEFYTSKDNTLSERMAITSSGDVCGPDADLSNCSSDERLKQDVTTLSYSIDQLTALNPVNFYWNQTAVDEYGYSTTSQQVGFVAQEVEAVIPEWVTTKEDGYKKVDDGMLKYALLQGFKQTASILNVAGATTSAPTLRSLFQGTSSPAIYIDEQGNVGIGEDPQQYGAATSTLEHALTVDGDVAATGFVNVSSGDFKRNVREVTEEEREGMLAKLRGLFVATYHYDREEYCGGSSDDSISNSPNSSNSPNKTDEEANSANEANEANLANNGCGERLGLIAEQAPEEVLSEDGRGVDLYKFVTFVASAVQAIADKVEALADRVTGNDEKISELEERISELENQLSNSPNSPNSSNSPNDAPAAGDNEAPVITINGNNPAQVDVGASYNDLGAIVTDNEDDNLGVNASVNGTDVGDQSNVSIDTSVAGEHTVEYRATDNAGNTGTATRTVIVGGGADDNQDTSGTNSPNSSNSPNSPNDANDDTASTTPETTEPVDTTAPEITLEGSANMELTVGDSYSEPGYSASDDTDGDITSEVVVGGDTVDTSTTGTYTVTYNVSDAAGNAAAEKTRTITVVEPEPAPEEEETSTDTATSTSEE